MVRFQEELIKKLNLLWQLLSVGGRGRGRGGAGTVAAAAAAFAGSLVWPFGGLVVR